MPEFAMLTLPFPPLTSMVPLPLSVPVANLTLPPLAPPARLVPASPLQLILPGNRVCMDNMSLIIRKPVFLVSSQVGLNLYIQLHRLEMADVDTI